MAPGRKWLGVTVGAALVALVLAGWISDAVANSGARTSTEKRVESFIRAGLQEAYLLTPLARDEVGGSYYIPDVFRSQAMTFCVATPSGTPPFNY